MAKYRIAAKSETRARVLSPMLVQGNGKNEMRKKQGRRQTKKRK